MGWWKLGRLAGWQAGDPGKSSSFHLKAACWQNPLILEGRSVFSRKAFNCLDEAHSHYKE